MGSCPFGDCYYFAFKSVVEFASFSFDKEAAKAG
jgi:hypothetical protein